MTKRTTPISAEMELHVLRDEEKRGNRRLMRLFDEEQRRKRKSIRLQLERDWNRRKWLREYSLKTGNNATTTGKDCSISSNDKKDNNDNAVADNTDEAKSENYKERKNHFDSNNKTALCNSDYTINNSLAH